MTLVKNSIPVVEISKSNDLPLEHHTVKLLRPEGDIEITNCYSPPTSAMALKTISVKAERHVVAGDFNSHSPSWGYKDMDPRGEELEDWMIDNKLILINHPRDKPTCFSRAWKTTSSPDLAMSTEDL